MLAADPQHLLAPCRAAGRELHTASDAMVNARLVALFADRQLYGKALGCFYLVHKCLDKCLQRSLSDPSETPWLQQTVGQSVPCPALPLSLR